MSSAWVVASLALIAIVLWDAFEAMLLPRRVTRSIRPARLYYTVAWKGWAALARILRPGKRRATYLSLFGPLSMLGLVTLWAAGLVVGFGLLQWALGSPLDRGPEPGPGELLEDLYLSGVTFFTLGYGDLAPVGRVGRALAVVEAGVGFGFLAVVISYLPVLYQAFSRRELTISLLDARAGSPPTAAELLLRIAPGRDFAALAGFLQEWERWAAELLESHLSFPVLALYRSQHDNQSWLGALTVILDACALVLAGVRGPDRYQAQLTFAMARHAVVDLTQAFDCPPRPPGTDRLPADALRRLRSQLRAAGLDVLEGSSADATLEALRGLYEPFVAALADYFLLPLPPILAEGAVVDNWQTSAWMRRTLGINKLARAAADDDHDD